MRSIGRVEKFETAVAGRRASGRREAVKTSDTKNTQKDKGREEIQPNAPPTPTAGIGDLVFFASFVLFVSIVL
jgi:hypothetical protein